MFPPVADFNFVVCGFATVAATVGYAYTRRQTSPSTSTRHVQPPDDQSIHPSDSMMTPDLNLTTTDVKPLSESQGNAVEIGRVDEVQESVIVDDHPVIEPIVPSRVLSRRSSLKRKRLEDDDYSTEGYPFNLLSIYPAAKRSKTPPTDQGDNDNDAGQVDVVSVPESQGPKNTVEEEEEKHCQQTDEPISVVNLEDVPSLTASPRSIITDDASEGPATPPDLPVPLPPSPQKDSKDTSCFQTPSATAAITTTAPSTPSLNPASARTPLKRAATFGSGFAAFASQGSSFGSPSRSATASPERPAWCIPSGSNDSTTSLILGNTEKPAIAPVEVPSSSPHAHITGEEDENVELELKNVKLFVKRGKMNFSEGMIGHIKLLSHKSTRDERILFRREPLWKVSMNVRLHTSVRCAYDAEEHVLRVVLAEPVETPGVPTEQWPREVVVYALKPGRSLPKSEFKDFAEALTARQSITATQSSSTASS